jgi:dipeptidyl aminopeptidase/acylaminoacyl peptidase
MMLTLIAVQTAAPRIASGARVQSLPFSAQDMVSLNRISEVEISPDGKHVLYTLRSTDMKANKGRTDIWELDVGRRGAKPLQLTEDAADDSSAEWSGGGQQVYFLSNRSGTSQVWRVPAAGGKAVQVTRLPLDVGSFRISPKDDRLLVSLAVFVDCADLSCTADRLARVKQHAATGVLYERTFVRHWDEWSDGRRSQLFSIDLDAQGLAITAPRNLTAGLDGDVPGKPFGDRADYAFNPDGSKVAFSMRVARTGESWSTNFDIYTVAAAGGTPVNLTAANKAEDVQPAFSPDGTQLAYLAMERPGYESDRKRLMLLDVKTGISHALTAAWDRSIDGFAWSRDGKSLFATAEHLGQEPLWIIDASSGRASAITGEGRVEGFSVGKTEIAYATSDFKNPADLYSVAFSGGKATQLTRINPDLHSTRKLGDYEQFNFAGANNDRVFAYLVKPVDFKPGRKYPVAVLIHGGPKNSWLNEWHWRWNPQNFAGAGYASLIIDFHGSTGYGQAFTDSISQDWGGKPFDDIKKGVEAALKKYPWMDGDRMCALGGSYGGYMVNWIAGNWPDRFKCLVDHSGIFDNRDMFYSTEELWFPEWENGGPEYSNKAAYAKHNPVDFVNQWKAPMLVIHGDLDFRIPYTQALSVFNALQRRGIPSEYLRFPDENHWITKPANSMQWYAVVIDWLDRWTGKPAAEAPVRPVKSIKNP